MHPPRDSCQQSLSLRREAPVTCWQPTLKAAGAWVHGPHHGDPCTEQNLHTPVRLSDMPDQRNNKKKIYVINGGFPSLIALVSKCRLNLS